MIFAKTKNPTLRTFLGLCLLQNVSRSLYVNKHASYIYIYIQIHSVYIYIYIYISCAHVCLCRCTHIYNLLLSLCQPMLLRCRAEIGWKTPQQIFSVLRFVHKEFGRKSRIPKSLSKSQHLEPFWGYVCSKM